MANMKPISAIFLLLAAALTAGAPPAFAAACTPGVNCYCDKVKGGSLNDPLLLMCEDFEAPTLYNNQGVGNGAPYYGPWYDATGQAGNRGVNSYWNRTYGNGASNTLFKLGEPASPQFGAACNFSACVGERVYDPADRWGGNNYGPVMAILRNGEFGSEVPAITQPSGSAGGGTGVFDGTASLGYMVSRSNPYGILGGKTFPRSGTFAVTQAMAMASNMATENPVAVTNWKFAEWSSNGGGGGDGLFMFGEGGTFNTTFPFYMFTFFDPASGSFPDEASRKAQCLANIASATVLKGTLTCDGGGSLLWRASSADYARPTDWPVGAWACVRGNYTNMGTANSHVEVWFTGPSGVEKKLIDFTANMTNHNARNQYNAYVWNNYANTNSAQVGGNPQGPTYRYEDNIHIRSAGPPVSCSQIGFGTSGPTDTQAPSAPTGLGAQTASSSQINLTWTAATDNVGVLGYKIFRSGTQIATTAGTSYSNTGLTASTAYSYTVAAYDAAGNTSAQSSAASATTQAAPPPSSSITMGETAVLTTADSGNGNLLMAQSATLAQTATLQSLSFYVTAASGSLRLGVYDATGPSGGPGQLKAQTDALTPVAGWNTANVITPVSLSAGAYWLAALPSSSALAFRKDIAAGVSCRYYAYPFGALPAAYSTAPTVDPAHWSFYATLNTASAAPSCNVNGDGATNIIDVQLAVNQALGLAPCTSDIKQDGACNVLDVQRIANAALGGACVTGP